MQFSYPTKNFQKSEFMICLKIFKVRFVAKIGDFWA